MRQYYYSFAEYLRKNFRAKVHRISLNAGFNCPNRDGTLSTKGCFFCNEQGFAVFAHKLIPLEDQINSSIDYYRKRFKAEKFIAYFQNGSNTYASVSQLRQAYDVIKNFPDFVGLFISTRPDCIDEDKLSLIESYSDRYDVWIEYGLQSAQERTLKAINRHHTLKQFKNAVEATAKRNIKIAAHVILGLPNETKSDMLETAQQLALLPVNGIKIHIFHILRDTQFHAVYKSGKISLLKQAEYVQLVCDFLEQLPEEYVIMRLVSNAKDDVLIGPKWINQKQKVLNYIENEFNTRGTHQGIYSLARQIERR